MNQPRRPGGRPSLCVANVSNPTQRIMRAGSFSAYCGSQGEQPPWSPDSKMRSLPRRLLFAISVFAALAVPGCGQGSVDGRNPIGPTSAVPRSSNATLPAAVDDTLIGGRVTDNSGRAIAGALVEVASPVDGGIAATTDDAGTYVVTGIQSTTFVLRYSHPEYQTVEREYTFALGTERTDLSVRLTLKDDVTARTTIGGRVADSITNRPIQGATVEIITPAAGEGIQTTTDGAGVYRLAGIQSTGFIARYSHPDYQTIERQYSFSMGTERTDLDTRLAAKPLSPNDGVAFLYEVDAAVSEAERLVIREGIDSGQRFLTEVFGDAIFGRITVRITNVAGNNPAFAGAATNGIGSITFNTQHPVWTSSAAINKRKIAIHELFHIHQGEYGLLTASERFPRWFVEGSAEYIGYQAIASQGLIPFATARRCMIYSAAHQVDPSLTLRAGGIPPSNGYWLAFMGIDHMSNSDARTFARIYKQPGGSWDAKLAGATGASGDAFFDGFEAARRRWSVPGTYECPR